MEIKSIKQRVTDAMDTIEKYNHIQLREWAIINHMDTAANFTKFKRALMDNGIDYELLKTGIATHKEKAETDEFIFSFPFFTRSERSQQVVHRAYFANGKIMTYYKEYRNNFLAESPEGVSFYFGKHHAIDTHGSGEELTTLIKRGMRNTGEKPIQFKDFIDAVNNDFAMNVEKFFHDTGLKFENETPYTPPPVAEDVPF